MKWLALTLMRLAAIREREIGVCTTYLTYSNFVAYVRLFMQTHAAKTNWVELAERDNEIRLKTLLQPQTERKVLAVLNTSKRAGGGGGGGGGGNAGNGGGGGHGDGGRATKKQKTHDEREQLKTTPGGKPANLHLLPCSTRIWPDTGDCRFEPNCNRSQICLSCGANHHAKDCASWDQEKALRELQKICDKHGFRLPRKPRPPFRTKGAGGKGAGAGGR